MATDEQLIQQIQKGNSSAYGQLFRKYYQQIYSVCFAILKNVHDAEEVTQETFIQAYLKLYQLKKPDKFFAWLKKIAQNYSKKYAIQRGPEIMPLNLKSAQTACEKSVLVRGDIPNPITPDEHLLRQELRDAILEAVEALPPKDREVVKAHIDGLNHSEISERLGISVQASMSRLYRARKKIAAHVKNLLNCIIGLPKTLPFKKIVSGGIEAMKIGTSKEVTSGIIGATQSLTFSVIFHIAFFIALSFVLPYKFHSDRQKVDVHLEVSLLPPAEEQQPASHPSKGEAKSVVSVKSFFPPNMFSLREDVEGESPSKTLRGFLSTNKPASQGETIIEMEQGIRGLPIGAGVSVKSGERVSGGSGKGEGMLPTVGVGGESVSEVGKVGVGLGDRVGELAKSRGGVDLEMKKVERLKPVIPQREKFGKQAGLSMLGDTGVADANDTLANVTKDMMLDRTEFGVPELPKGEPGGIVIGRGKDIRGHLRFPRFTCSMVDDRVVLCFVSKALPTLMKWLNANTNIKVDMNVEGGRVSPMDAALFKSPIVFLFGQDEMIASIFSPSAPPIWASYKTFPGSSSYPPVPRASKHLTKMERERIRKYLLEKGGILFIDTQPRLNALAKKGKWAPGQEFLWSMRMKQELREILPEYNLQRIPNEHELFHCYYELDGAPPGPHPSMNSRFWHAKTPYLEGIFVDGHLAVIYSEMWYWAAMNPNWGYSTPSVFRFLTNTVVYALTHSGISDKSRYVPEKEIPGEIPKKPPVIPPPTPNLRP